MTTQTKARKYDVFRAEQRAGGRVDFLETIEAADETVAQLEAEARCECKPTHHLYVVESDGDGLVI